MNLLESLVYLSEAQKHKISYFNELVKDDISPDTLKKLASFMKKDEYDNEALAILKTLQSASIEETEFIEKHLGFIYHTLKKLKRGNSSFNPNKVMEDSIRARSSREFWLEKKRDVEADKPSKKEVDYNTPGLKTANVKTFKTFYAFFPKNYKDQNNLEFKELDLEKSYQDIKKIAAEIAKLDRSGDEWLPEITHGDDKPLKANENHWCVASSAQEYFRGYKKNDGIFVIIVKRKPDGSPDWSQRWLYFTEGDDEWELADKFNNHDDLNIPKEVKDFLQKINDDFNSKSFNKKLDRNKIEKEIMKARENSTPSKSYKKFLEILDMTIKKRTELGLNPIDNRMIEYFKKQAQALFSDEGLSKGERDALHNNKKVIGYYLKKKKLDGRDLVRIPVNRSSGIFFYPKRQHPDFVLELMSFPMSTPLYLNDVNTMKEVKEFIDKAK